MSMLFAIVFTCLACRIVPRLLVKSVATVMGTLLVIANRRARQKLLEVARLAGTADWNRRPSRVERRVLQRGLNAALDMTAFTSLLPDVAARAHKIVRH